MDQQTMGWVLLGAAVLILALLIYLLTQVKKSCQNDISIQLQRLQSDLERSAQADILTLGKYLMQSQQSQSQSESRALLEQLTQFENRLSHSPSSPRARWRMCVRPWNASFPPFARIIIPSWTKCAKPSMKSCKRPSMTA